MDVRDEVIKLSTECLEAEITTMAGHLAAAECRWLLLIAEYDRREAWRQWECRSCAHWLSWHASLDLRSAYEKLRVAHALEACPTIQEEFAAGRLSYSKVRAITRIATVGTERDLIDFARHATASQVERFARAFRRADPATELREANERHERQFVSWCWDDDGSLAGRFKLDPEVGAVFLKALEAAIEQCSAEQSLSVRRADALGEMAESFLAHGSAERAPADRHLVQIHVDPQNLVDDSGTVCALEDGPALAAETVRRLACDASLVAMAFDADGNPLAVSRKTRTIPAALRRAVKARDRRCRFPGCDAPIRDLHHIVHYAQGGPTCLTNLAGFCGFHHRAVHEGEHTVEFLADGSLRVTRPDGRVLETSEPTLDTTDGSLERLNHDHDVQIAVDTVASRWYGDALDLDWAVSGFLAERDRRARIG